MAGELSGQVDNDAGLVLGSLSVRNVIREKCDNRQVVTSLLLMSERRAVALKTLLWSRV